MVLPCQIKDALPTPNFIWYKDDKEIQSGNVLKESSKVDLRELADGRYTIYPVTGSLEIRSLEKSDEATYKCKASNLDKTRTSPAGRLKVVSLSLPSVHLHKHSQVHTRSTTEDTNLKFVAQPPETMVGRVGEQLTLECAANAQPSVTVR